MFWVRLNEFLSRSICIPVWFVLLIAAIGASVGGMFWWLGPGQRPWLEVLKDKDGVMVGLHPEPQKMPKSVLAQLPTPGDNTPLRDPARIKALAEQYGLYECWETNPHLYFDDDAIDYWSKQGRPAWELELRFLARRLVLAAAERADARIPYAGDHLSKWSDRVYPLLLKKAQEK